METLNIVANLAQALGLMVTLLALFLSLNEKRDNQDLQIFIYLSESFRKSWESEWEDALLQIEEQNPQNITSLPPNLKKSIRSHLKNQFLIVSLSLSKAIRY